jgi:hypothetical protein
MLRGACGVILQLRKDHVMSSLIFVSLALNAVVCVSVYAVVLPHVSFNIVWWGPFLRGFLCLVCRGICDMNYYH